MRKLWQSIFLFAQVALIAGCFRTTYPADNLKESLLAICKNEYGIDDVDVKIVGETIGVYLPLKELFAADFKEAAITGKVRDPGTLFDPSPEALEKIDDVLLSLSRVILSTDRPLKFYVLEATDVEKTGMQLIVNGYINDIKRLRFSDISRDEYRKRMMHELRLNRSVMWHRPVRRFFRDLENLSTEEVQQKYFSESLPLSAVQNLFYSSADVYNVKHHWEITDIRSAAVRRSEILVYTKVLTYPENQKEQATELQFLFVLSLTEEEARIMRIIPFQYKDRDQNMQKLSFPKGLQIERNLENWEEEFPLKEMHLGPFLADQLTRRVQAILASNERIQNTFREVALTFAYNEDDPVNPFFSMNLEATLRDFNHYTRTSMVYHEDMIYLLSLASREFVNVLRSYQFGEFKYLKLNLAREPNEWLLGRDNLELFRRKKIDFQGLLSLQKL